MLHARHHLLADVATLPEREPAIQIHQDIVGKGVLQRKVDTGGGNARSNPRGVVDGDGIVAMGAGKALECNAGLRKAAVGISAVASVAPADGHALLVGSRNLDRRPKSVHRKPLQQRFALDAVRLDDKAVTVAPDHEIEHDLALWCQQRSRTRFVCGKGAEIGGDQVLQE